MKTWLSDKLDSWSYSWFYRRWCKANRKHDGMLYLIGLHITDYYKRSPLDPAHERATRMFYETQRDAGRMRDLAAKEADHG